MCLTVRAGQPVARSADFSQASSFTQFPTCTSLLHPTTRKMCRRPFYTSFLAATPPTNSYRCATIHCRLTDRLRRTHSCYHYQRQQNSGSRLFAHLVLSRSCKRVSTTIAASRQAWLFFTSLTHPPRLLQRLQRLLLTFNNFTIKAGPFLTTTTTPLPLLHTSIPPRSLPIGEFILAAKKLCPSK